MADTNFPDEWLAHSLEGVLTPELLVELRTKAQAGQTLWETLVAQKVVNDEQILTALSTRFRLKLADVKEVDLTVKEKVPEQLARRYQILPLRVTDSFLEIATANPFDLDAEKALAFATAREIRMQLLAPSKISEKLDEVYRPEKTLDKMFQQMEGSPELVQLVEEVGPDEIAVSEEQASQRPIVRLVDLIISEAILARSSDIHIEPEEGGVAERYRIDGVLRQQMKIRSEEHTSELQSRSDLVCRLLLEKKKNTRIADQEEGSQPRERQQRGPDQDTPDMKHRRDLSARHSDRRVGERAPEGMQRQCHATR